jgi:hypothetical protein
MVLTIVQPNGMPLSKYILATRRRTAIQAPINAENIKVKVIEKVRRNPMQANTASL